MRRSQLMRLIFICRVFIKYGLDDVVLSIPWLRPIRFMVYCNPINWVRRHKQSKAERLQKALEELGPLFVKFGQILSTRRDIIPPDIIACLAKLQDQVEPFAGDQAKAMIEASLEQPIEQVFSQFSETALASASVAQVHAATLHSGEEVIVKVLRPNVHAVIKQDIQLLYKLANWVERYVKSAKRLKPIAVVKEIENNLRDELDLMREAANASQLRRNFEEDNRLYIPKIYWPYCRTDVLVMEKIEGIPVDDIDALKAANINLPLLAKRGVELFYAQVFRDNFFHADMHPGNIFVSRENPQDPHFIAVDFGIVGSLDQEDKRYLLANFVAFFKRDYRQVAELHIECGWVPPYTRATSLEGAIRVICEPMFQRPLKDISFGYTLMRLFQVAQQFEMEVLPQLLLLQKTLLNIEGMGRTLYPDLDLWATAKPFLEKWMREQVGVKGLLRRVRKQLPTFSDRLPEIPGLVYDFLKQQQKPVIIQQPDPVKPPKRRMRWLMVLGVILLIVGAALGFKGASAEVVKWWLQTHYAVIGSVGVVLLIIGWWFR